MSISIDRERLLTYTGPGAELLPCEPMRRHTSFLIGGPADLLVVVDSEEHIVGTVSFCRDFSIPLTVMGNGSNLLVGDGGIEGVVLKTSGSFNRIEEGEDGRITAQSGVLLSRLASFAAGLSLTGMEFAHGIPGSLGGAVYMNAGAYGGEIKDIVIKTRAVDQEGNVIEVTGEGHRFGYRTSVFCQNGAIITAAELSLSPGDDVQIRERMGELARKRQEKQPIEKPSAGSVFKRPPGCFAGTLIEECGLKGFSIGGAMVSHKHAGFIINTGGARAADVLAVIEHVAKTVKERRGVELCCEIKMVGRF